MNVPAKKTQKNKLLLVTGKKLEGLLWGEGSKAEIGNGERETLMGAEEAMLWPESQLYPV